VADTAGRLVRLIGACQDITERKTAERELAAALDQALEASRVKSAFLANMSHEIRTPLNVILGSTSVIAEHLPQAEREKLRPFLGGAERAGRRLIRMIQGMLDLSRIETGAFSLEVREIDVGALVAQRIEDFEVLAQQKRVAISCDIAEPATVRFDEYCLSQSLTNLLDNAVKFTPAGAVSVRLYRDRRSSVLSLEVRDTGVGIDAPYLARLFEPFSQEESGFTRGFDGSGLGLALTKSYVELNGASITAASEKGRGAVFTIRFPPGLEARGARPRAVIKERDAG
jgi:signal transduction histidine kinase